MTKKKLFILLTLLIALVLCPTIHNEKLSNKDEIVIKTVISPNLQSEFTYEYDSIHTLSIQKAIRITEEPKLDTSEIAIQEMEEKMRELDDITDKKEWFVSYKEIIEEYKSVIDPPESIYDYFSDKELDMFFRVVQAEVGEEYTFEQKCNIAAVILNRLESDDFPDDILKVLSKNQFQSIANGKYKKVEVSDNTILACEYVFLIEDTTDGALYYMNKKWSTKKNIRWFENNLTYLFTDGAGHSFYK